MYNFLQQTLVTPTRTIIQLSLQPVLKYFTTSTAHDYCYNNNNDKNNNKSYQHYFFSFLFSLYSKKNNSNDTTTADRQLITTYCAGNEGEILKREELSSASTTTTPTTCHSLPQATLSPFTSTSLQVTSLLEPVQVPKPVL